MGDRIRFLFRSLCRDRRGLALTPELCGEAVAGSGVGVDGGSDQSRVWGEEPERWVESGLSSWLEITQ